MKKIVLLIFMFNVAMTTANAQYSNATLNGPWLLYQNPLSPYNDSLVYILFDGNGSITDFGAFGTFSGSYSVNASVHFPEFSMWMKDHFSYRGSLPHRIQQLWAIKFCPEYPIRERFRNHYGISEFSVWFSYSNFNSGQSGKNNRSNRVDSAGYWKDLHRFRGVYWPYKNWCTQNRK